MKFAGNKINRVGNDTYQSRYGNKWQTYNYSQKMAELTDCDAAGASALKSQVDAIKPNGCTRTDYGLELVEGISSGRSDAQKIVVLFTDGSPTSGSDFEADVANNAVTAAKKLKDDGAIVYTIGIFDGANPGADPNSGRAGDTNRFMHAASSNYPSATGYTARSLGARAQGSDYYKSAKNAAELARVFDDISQAITSGSGYPTEIQDGYDAHKSGYITFADELGDFMQVDGFTAAEIDGKPFGAAAKTSNGNTDTYEFSGEAKNLVITVERAGEDNPRQGDKVTVKIPASLIPLRAYKVDTAAGTFEVKDIDGVSPIRVTYTSSVKPVARQNLFTPDKVPGLPGYIDGHWDRDADTVYFLANKWSGGEMGDTVAEFEPADTNSYYYFQKDTPIYTDKDCTQRAKNKPEGGNTYYYKDEFVAKDAATGKPAPAYEVVSFDGGQAASFEGALGSDSDGWYFAKGTARLAYIDQLHTEKSEIKDGGGNATGTARDVLNPQWNNADATKNATHVRSHLGNNGKILLSLAKTPVTLDTKAGFGLAKVLEGRDWTDGDHFTFNIELVSGDRGGTDKLQGSATVTKADLDEGGRAAIDFGNITFNKVGTYVYKITEAEEGADAGMTYSSNVATVTVAVTIDASGALHANVTKVDNPIFTNTYTTELSYSAAGGLSITKTLDGRAMEDGQFGFTVTPADAASAAALGLAEGGTHVTAPAAGDGETVAINLLGGRDVTFTQADAGKMFTYTVSEDGSAPSGYTYDTAARTVTIAVADDGAGKLTATTTVSGGPEGTKTYTYVTGETGAVPAVIPFNNSYRATTDAPGGGSVPITATKQMTGRALVDGEFTFHLAYAGTEVPLVTTRNDAAGTVDFGALSYSTDQLAELVRSGRAHLGMTADGNRQWTIEYVAFEDTAGLPTGVSAETASFTVTVNVVDNGDGSLSASPLIVRDSGVFRNVYATGDPVKVQLNGTKVLTAAEGLTPGDITGKFTFTLASDDSAAPIPSKGTSATNDANGDIDFGELTFTLDDLNRALGDEGEGPATQSQDATADEAGSGSAMDVATSEPATSGATAATVDETGAVTGDTSAASGVSAADPAADSAASEFSEETSASADRKVDVSLDSPVLETAAFATGEPAAAAQVTTDPAVPRVRSHTFTYTVTESGSAPGVTNDPNPQRTVSFTVTDDGQGNLTVTRDPAEGPAFTFTNTYGVEPTTSSVTDQVRVTKVLDGRDLHDGEFTFELGGEDGTDLTVKNDANGGIWFDELTFDQVGTYVYTVREVKGDEPGMTYDDAVFTVTITVTDNGEGQLEASAAYARDGEAAEDIVFNNSYTKPEDPADPPKTPGNPGTPVTPGKPGGGTPATPRVPAAVRGLVAALPTTGDRTVDALIAATVLAVIGAGLIIRGRHRI